MSFGDATVALWCSDQPALAQEQRRYGRQLSRFYRERVGCSPSLHAQFTAGNWRLQDAKRRCNAASR